MHYIQKSFVAIFFAVAWLAASLYSSNAQAQFGGGAFTSRPAPPPVTTIEAFSLPADKQGQQPYLLRVYRLQEDAVPVEVTEAIQDLIEPGSWKSEEAVYLKSFQRNLIIRHRPTAHRQVYQLLRALQAIDAPTGQSRNTIHFGSIPVVGDK